MMRKKLLSIFVMAALLVALPALSQAGHGKKDDCGKGNSCIKCEMKAKECKVTQLKNKVKLLWAHKEMLGLDDKQLADIKQIKLEAIKALIQRHADIEIIKVDVTAAMWMDTINLAELNSLLDRKYDAEKEYAKTYVKAISDIQQKLTEKQRAEWKELVKALDESGQGCGKCAGKKDGKYCPVTGKKLDGKK